MTATPTPTEIIEARTTSGLSQTAAAKVLGKTLRAWQYWESGQRKMDPIMFLHFKRETGQS